MENATISAMKKEFPDKFASEESIFSKIHPGDRIFISTACGEPQYLVNSLVKYVESHPKAFFDAELLQVWTLGIAPYTDQKFKKNFRHNSFFIGKNTRDAINKGMADYTPIFLSEVPRMFSDARIPIDVALIQVSPPDEHGYMSLGISVDISKAAAESARLVIAQVNSKMPRTHGDSFIHVSEVDFFVCKDEPLLEYESTVSDKISKKIGDYVARIIDDGDTIQVGYGSIPNAIISKLADKKDLGVHTELISDGLVELIKKGAITNSKKTINRGHTVASFCMGKKATYDFINNNPSIKFHSIDYVNNPRVISSNENMVAINSGLEIDLTGQATAESLGNTFYSGIGGQADFMRGAVLSKGGKTILAMQSTADNDKVSRIVPFLKSGAGVTLTRGDVHYVVTEYGIAYLHGKNMRERAMDLISIAHPKFRPALIEDAKKRGLIYSDQAFIPGKRGEYPEELETYRTTRTGLNLFLRPVKISDEPLLKDFFYSLSDESTYKRFISARRDMPHERLQEFVIIDYTQETLILALLGDGEGNEEVVAVGQYGIDESRHTAEVAIVVRDDFQNRGIGHQLLSHLTYLAKKQGLLGFTAEVLVDNSHMIRLFEDMGFDIDKKSVEGVYEMKMIFKTA
jgi:acyl-CoA hydrolase/GNAT superfamily N-acetyltransferase